MVIKNDNDDDDDDDHNILLYVGLKLSLKALLLYLQLYLVQCERGHIHVVLNVILCTLINNMILTMIMPPL